MWIESIRIESGLVGVYTQGELGLKRIETGLELQCEWGLKLLHLPECPLLTNCLKLPPLQLHVCLCLEGSNLNLTPPPPPPPPTWIVNSV